MKYLFLILVTCLACSKASKKDDHRREQPKSTDEASASSEAQIEPGLQSKPKLEEKGKEINALLQNMIVDF